MFSQHVISVYLDAGTLGTDTAMLSFTFSGTFNRFWDIKVTQIPCKANYEYVQVYHCINRVYI